MKKLILIVFAFFLMGCSNVYSLTLSDGVNVIDDTVNIKKIKPNQELDLKITPEENHYLEDITVNGISMIDEVHGDILTIKVTKNTVVEATFKSSVSSLRFKDNINRFTFDLNQFRLNDIKLELQTSEGLKTIGVTKDLLSEEDFLKLFTTGDYFINVRYLGVELEALIQMTSTFPQPKIPDVIVYALKEVEESKATYRFYTIGSYTSYMMNIYQKRYVVGQAMKSGDGIFDYRYIDQVLRVIHSFGEVRSGHNEIFSLAFNWDIDFDYITETCEFYTFDETIQLVESIRYYQR